MVALLLSIRRGVQKSPAVPLKLFFSFGGRDNLEMRYEIVEGFQGDSSLWLDDGSIRLRAGKLLDSLHRVPQGQHNKFDPIAVGVAEQISSPVSFDCAQRRKYSLGGMADIFTSLFGS